MSDPQHLNWIKEGVDKWNARRETTKFDPDFSGPTSASPLLSGISLRGANLRGANFSNAPQISVDFREADLTGSNFTECLLSGARFDRAILTDANFSRADFGGVDVPVGGTPVRFDPVSLTDAALTRTDLTSARLTGAALGGTKLWESHLFRQAGEPDQCDLPTCSVNNVAQLMEVIRLLKQTHHTTDDPNGMTLYFRGEPKSGEDGKDWVLNPTVKRDGFDAFESAMLVDLMASHPAAFGEIGLSLSKWILAQHHSLKTRFLDVTRNPLVALFFACEQDQSHSGKLHIFAVPSTMIKSFNSDTVSVIANFARLSLSDQDMLLGKVPSSARARGNDYSASINKLYQLIEEEKPGFEKRIDPRDFFRVILIEPQISSDRVRAQSGAMLASAFHQRLERKFVQLVNNAEVYGHYTLSVPAETTKRDIMDELSSLEITRPRLFPGIDETAVEITQQYASRLR